MFCEDQAVRPDLLTVGQPVDEAGDPGGIVRTVHDGEAAVAAAAEFRPDMAVLDIGMPRLNGYDAARRLRGQPWGAGVVLAAVTGWGQEEDVRRAREAGFDHHLTKPVDPATLTALLVGDDAGPG